MKTLFLAGAALAALAASPALAEPPTGGPAAAPEAPVTRAQMQQEVEQRFKEMDANHDGVLTENELGSNGARMMARLDTNQDGKVTLEEMTTATLARFDRADANHDGILTPDERAAARDAMRARMQREGAQQQVPQGQ
jgi:Ca2+-binding EF-hand superfamily protein